MAQTKRPRTRSARPAAVTNAKTSEVSSTNGGPPAGEADAAEVKAPADASTAAEASAAPPVPQASSQRAQIEAAEKAAQEEDPPKPMARPGGARRKKKRSKRGSPLRTAVAAALLIGVLAVAAVGVFAFGASSDDSSTSDDAAGVAGIDGTGDDSDAAGAGDDTTGSTGTDDGGDADGAGTAGDDAVGSDAVSVPLPDGIVRYVAHTGGGGVRVRTACAADASTGAVWPEGTKVAVDERGTGECAGWSVAASGSTQSWIRNDYLSESKVAVSAGGGSTGGGGGSATGAIVTSTSSVLPKPGVSWAQTYCIQYETNGTPGEVCRTFPSVQRSGWLPYDVQTFAALTDARQQMLIDCYLSNVAVGKELNSCVFMSVLP